MGVLLAKSMGNHVTVISTSNKKEALAKQIGADNYLISKDEESMAANAQTLDLVIDTIPMGHDINPYMNLLKKKGTVNIIGAFPDPPFQVILLAKKFCQINIHIIHSLIRGVLIQSCPACILSCTIQWFYPKY